RRPSADTIQAGWICMKAILVVEDDQVIRNLIGRILRVKGYIVSEVATTDEALLQTSVFDLVIVEMILPGCYSGIQAAIKLRKTRPGLKVLVTSGVPPDLWPQLDFKRFVNLPAGSLSYLAK